MATTVERYTNTVEHHESTALAAVDDAFTVSAHADTFTFALVATGSANFTVALELNHSGSTDTWFEIDTTKTINAAGNYEYFYSGKPASRVRCRIASISSGTPSVEPHIIVHYNG